MLEGHTDVVHTVVVLDDHRIVSGSNDRTVRVWNIEMAKLEFKGPMPEITKVRVQQLWYRVVDRNNVLNGHRGSVNALAVLSDQRIVSGSNDKTVLVWDLKMRKQIVRSRRSSSVRDASLPLNVVSHSVIPLPRPRRLHNQPQFAYGRTDSNLWPLIARTHMSGVNAVKVFDDRLIVSGLSDGTMHVWDLETGKDIIQFQFDAPIEKLAFRKDVLAIQTNDDRAFVFRTHF